MPDAERLDKLDHMLANLQAHIDQRAEEIAQPLIDEARKAAAVEVKGAQGMQQRAEDLVVELRRRIEVLERYTQSYQGRAAAISSLHPPIMDEGRKKCGTCSENGYPRREVVWPCKTFRALGGLDADHG